jgi:hypothetical protein
LASVMVFGASSVSANLKPKRCVPIQPLFCPEQNSAAKLIFEVL